MTKFFGFIKSTLKFIKIILLFLILILLLYWIKNLASLNWNWLSFFAPILDLFLDLGKMISSGSLDLWGAVFEYKYMWALAIIGLFYGIIHGLYRGTEFLEDVCSEGHKVVKKFQENKFNDALRQEQINEQTAIKKYRIFVSASIKKKFTHLECNIDLDEQVKIMNKFLIEKLSTTPIQFENGYVYTFCDFNSIDTVLETFFKLINSNAPLNYVICVQILTNNKLKEEKQLKALIDLKFENKISMMSDVAFRYKFNKFHRYGTSQVGLFQKENDTMEIHEFIEI